MADDCDGKYQILLLVEDDPAHTELISRSFERHNCYKLVRAHSLADAYNVLLTTSPNLIITDIGLPDGKGTDLLKKMHKDKECPVIVMTSFGDETIAVDAMKAGASDYIVKSGESFIELPTITKRILGDWQLILEKKIAVEKQNRMTAILEATPDLIAITDVNGFLTYLNKAGTQMLGLAENKSISKLQLADFYLMEDAKLVKKEGIPCAIEHGIWKNETTFLSKSNEQILTSHVLITHKSAQGQVEFFSTVARDIRYIRSAEAKIEYLAYHDTLTGLPNRNELQRQLDFEIGRVQRQKGQSALLFIDLDNFKYVNDSLGHPTGDLVLKEMAHRLKSVLRNEDTLARQGGDEFVAILTSLSTSPMTALNQARDVSVKLNKRIAMDMHFGGMTFNLTASIGISMFSNETTSAHELLRFADTAMFEAKKSGKNQFEVFHKDMGNFVHHQLELEHKLRKASNNNEFVLYYQPKIYSDSGLIHGAEALLRWNDPVNGITLPATFLGILESSGLISEIGEWVLEQSFKQLSLWIEAGIWDVQHRLSINISAQQFHNERFSKTMINLLEASNVPPQCIDIEITEHSVINDVESAVLRMQELISQGITFTLDDFGTGYSSLGYLKKLPVIALKIDKSFIDDITTDKNDEALVKSILDISKNLGLSVVAEGVETQEQVQILKQHQCDYLQGFYFSEPVSAMEFELLLRQQKPDH